MLRSLASSTLAAWLKLKRLRSCLGLTQAARTWWHHRFDVAGQIITVRVRGVGQPLVLRARSSDLDVLMKVFSDREYALPLRQKPRSILDGGANVGFAAVYYAELYPDATVVAVEPDRDNFLILEKNTAGYPSITVFEAAIWSSDTQVELEDPGMDQHAFRVGGLSQQTNAPRRSVAALSIETLADRAHVPGFDLVKLDVEGAEREILLNAGGWLPQSKVLVAELHDRFVPGCSKQFYIAVRGFDGDYVIGENTVAFRKGWLPDAYIEHGYWAAASMH
jgi:FkbM family methyltransferase